MPTKPSRLRLNLKVSLKVGRGPLACQKPVREFALESRMILRNKCRVTFQVDVAYPGLASSIHLETHTRSQTPHFMSYPMDMTWILQHQVYFLAKCHIHVISMS